MRVIEAGGGEVVGDSADRRVEILCDDDALHATWSRFGPHRDGADLHIHRRHADLFYVLDGELTVMLGPAGEETTVPAGWLVRVPPFVVHGFRNASDADVRYLNFHAPGEGFADFMRGLRDGRPIGFDQVPPPEDGGRPASEAVIEDLGDQGALRITTGGVEAYYVLGGELVLTGEAGGLRAPAGSWIQVAPGSYQFPLGCGTIRM